MALAAIKACRAGEALPREEWRDPPGRPAIAPIDRGQLVRSYQGFDWKAAIATSIGTDSRVLVRAGSLSRRSDLALEASSASTRPNARFWCGKITNQPLAAMISARYMPT